MPSASSSRLIATLATAIVAAIAGSTLFGFAATASAKPEDYVSRRFKPAGTEGYRTAEVTLGGLDTDAVSSKTFEAKAVPGLFFIGEVLDVTGELGGFNFQWAWASAHAAGLAL